MKMRAIAVVCVVVLGFVLATVAAVYAVIDTKQSSLGSTLKITSDAGHGSGIHLGGGNVISAAHVIPKDATELTAKFDDGSEQKIEVLWVNRAYDVALLKLADASNVAASPLSCRVPFLDEAVVAKGNPVNLEFIKTRGFISGGARTVGPWRSVVPADIALAGGMSGGGLFDASGNLVGILVGTMVQQIGFGGTFVGIAYIVPGRVVCDLLARA